MDKKAKPGVFARMSRSFRDMRGEMKKVVWPGKKQIMNNTAVVLVFMVVMAVLIGAFDGVLAGLIQVVFGGA